EEGSKSAIAVGAGAEMGLRMFAVWAENLPASGPELEALVRLWEREAVLGSGALLVVTDTAERNDHRGSAQVSRPLESVIGARISQFSRALAAAASAFSNFRRRKTLLRRASRSLGPLPGRGRSKNQRIRKAPRVAVQSQPGWYPAIGAVRDIDQRR